MAGYHYFDFFFLIFNLFLCLSDDQSVPCVSSVQRTSRELHSVIPRSCAGLSVDKTKSCLEKRRERARSISANLPARSNVHEKLELLRREDNGEQ